MTRPQPRRPKPPSEHHPVEGQAVTYRHPAGDVRATIEQVTTRTVSIKVVRHGGLEPLTLKFTLRPDGEYRLVGTTNSARPALIFPES